MSLHSIKAFPPSKEISFAEKYTEERRLWLEESQRQKHAGYVYFIQESGTGAIKIGTTRSVDARLKQISCDNPHETKLIGAMRGGLTVEMTIHWLFWCDNIRGEWHRPSADLLRFIESLPKIPIQGRRIPW